MEAGPAISPSLKDHHILTNDIFYSLLKIIVLNLIYSIHSLIRGCEYTIVEYKLNSGLIITYCNT